MIEEDKIRRWNKAEWKTLGKEKDRSGEEDASEGCGGKGGKKFYEDVRQMKARRESGAKKDGTMSGRKKGEVVMKKKVKGRQKEEKEEG